MARTRKTQTKTQENSKGEIQMAERGTLSSLQMIEVDDAELDSARGGRGHGEYDNFVAAFLDAKNDAGEPIRGTKVGFEGVKPTSIKTGLKSAIERAEKNNLVADGELQVRGKDEAVYLVRQAVEAAA